MTRLPIDICNRSIGCKIICDQVCCDSNGVSNLLVKDQLSQNNGFMAERFVKPPVNVTLLFPINFEISHIVIKNHVGAQTTTFIDILSAIGPLSTFSPPFSCLKSDTTNDSKTVDCQYPIYEYHEPDVYVMVGRMSCDNPKSTIYVNKLYSRERNEDIISQASSFLSHVNNRALSRTCSIRLCLRRTSNGSVPGLGRIEIWGSPSKSCSKQEIQKFTEFCNNSKKIEERARKPSPRKKTKESLSCVPQAETVTVKELTTDDIPSDFIDPISCEIMTLPVILPCGKTVDQSTLDKYNKSEESWGRSPNDPFTGIVFHKDSNTLPNVPLKAQVDSFLIKHSNSSILSNHPRTIGRNPLKRKFDEIKAHIGPVCSVSATSNLIPEQTSFEITLPNQKESASASTHEQQLSLSLDIAMNHIINSNKFRKTIKKIETVCCQLCNLNPQVMYLSSCSHHICYDCLVIKKIVKCDCGKKLLSHDMKRVHI